MRSSDLTAILDCLQSHRNLTSAQMRAIISWFLTGQADADAMRRFLVLLAEKGETVEELVGAALALRDSMVPITTHRRPIVDTCGTGGDGAKTFNISTAAALAIASAGVAVAKHGNRKITSSTGSADVLAELGINLDASPQVVEKCLNEVGICFCFAPHFHPAMKNVGAVRREIAHPTIFNRLGPLANPAAADRQVLGVGDKSLQHSMAKALRELGTIRSLVVRGDDGVDEISLSAATQVLEVTQEAITPHMWSPNDFGVQRAPREQLFADDPVASADCIRRVLDGEPGPMRDVVVINAAAGLWISGVSQDLRECSMIIQQALDRGETKRTVQLLAQATGQSS